MADCFESAWRVARITAGVVALCASSLAGQVAVRAQTVHTSAGPPIADGVVVIGADGRIEAVGPASSTRVPAGYEVIECEVATPGLIDVRSTVGLTGIYNVDHDQDVLERSSPVQAELRAFDAYNPRERLVRYVRSFGVTTAHVGHAPGELFTGQTMIVKTRGDTVEQALVVADRAVTATLGPLALKSGTSSPGTRGKQVAMLRAELIKAREHAEKVRRAGEGSGDDGAEAPPRDLRLEALASVLAGERPLIVTANTSQDIAGALRLAEEFGFELWLDNASEVYLLLDEVRAAGAPVLLHPTMQRAWGETSNLSYGTAARLADAGMPFAIQSGYEGYVPKVRVVLFEAGVAAGYGGLGFERALRAVTIDAARILGIEARVGSLEVGKDGDVAMYSGDPFEYTTHCLGVLIEGERFGGEREFEVGYP